MEQEKQQKKKPKWLRVLEKQSWQAELIISGIAIFGTLQLPSLFIGWAEYWLIKCTEEMAFFVHNFLLYLIVAACGLIFIFIGHFIIRAFWIGFLGLNSVFPQGIRVEKNAIYGEEFMRLVKQEFPDMDAFNERLDNIGSVLFSIASFLAILFFSIIVIFLVFLLLAKGIVLLFGWSDKLGLIFGILVAISLTPSLVISLIPYLLFKKEDKKQELRQFRLYQFVNKIFINIFYVPVGYISFTYISNVKSKYLLYIYLMASFISFFGGAFIMKQSPIIKELKKESRYFSFNNKENTIYIHNYEELHPIGIPLFTPCIPSTEIKGAYLPLFLPKIGREEEACQEKYGEWERPENISNSENKSKSDSFYLQQQYQFNRIYVNDSLYTNLELFYTKQQGSEGLRTYIPTTAFLPAKNILRIEKQYFDEEKQAKTVLIPFFFTK